MDAKEKFCTTCGQEGHYYYEHFNRSDYLKELPYR